MSSHGYASLGTFLVPKLELWTPEAPNLHFVSINMLNASGSKPHVVDGVIERFGFRQVALFLHSFVCVCVCVCVCV